MITVSPADPSDVSAIQSLLRETWNDTYSNHLSQETLDEVYKKWQSIEFLTKQIENPDFYFPIAKEDQELLGLATARLVDDIVMLFRLYVHPGHQRHGVGNLLLENVVFHYPRAKKIQLHVEVLNPKGKAFYTKHGFKQIKVEQEKIGTEVIDELLMEKTI